MDIQEILKKRIGVLKNQDTVLNTVAYNAVINVFFTEKGIAINNYIVSVKFSQGRLSIKTNKPLIGEEIKNIEMQLEKQLIEKFEKLGKKYKKIDIYVR